MMKILIEIALDENVGAMFSRLKKRKRGSGFVMNT